jgi:hypothetical protein
VKNFVMLINAIMAIVKGSPVLQLIAGIGPRCPLRFDFVHVAQTRPQPADACCRYADLSERAASSRRDCGGRGRRGDASQPTSESTRTSNVIFARTVMADSLGVRRVRA